METISINDYSKLDIRIGTVLSVQKVEDTDRLLKFEFDLGTEKRTIIGGWALSYPNEQELVGKQMPVLCNLEPRTIKGIESMGMILSAVHNDLPIALLPEKEVDNGAQVK